MIHNGADNKKTMYDDIIHTKLNIIKYSIA